MECSSRHTVIAVTVFLLLCVGANAQEHAVGGHFAYNEFSAVCQMDLEDNQKVRFALNLDMTNVISGRNLYPGGSAGILYLFEFASVTGTSGETLGFVAGPGFNAGYVRNLAGEYGIMASLSGCIGLEYRFLVPVSLSLTFEPDLGIHLNKDRFGNIDMDLYMPGLIFAFMPHVGIRYMF